MKKFAVRNLRLCTKDCICLYVCPTGASDTENSIIDVDKCIGCGACAEACPSKAISMVPADMPPQQPKHEEVVSTVNHLAESKMEQELLAQGIAAHTESEGLKRLMLALVKSNRLMAEDLLREAGYMLPQSANAHDLLEKLIKNPPNANFPLEAAKSLLKKIPCNEERTTEEKIMERWKCSVCGYVHEGALPKDFKCPICKQPASVFVKLEEE